MKQRLALFLDGTWNTEDDSTNVLHAYNLTQDGIVKDKRTKEDILQKRYYDQGVGTGILDSILGGAFGIGLENNVRQAYNWLVDHYNDGDEIFIFGFSRGAFTARSLMGFIANCGLVRRGAPLTVSQLWKGNRLIGQVRDRKYKFDESKLIFRRISSIEDNPEKITEQLLKKWSRRVDITYMGIFDTVSALGIDALGIPGISSKMALNHNQNPSGILQSCRHALAIDENRNSFRLTPIRHFVKKNAKTAELNPFQDKIKQRWFVGSHSNIGGSYPDNILANSPLQWIFYGAVGKGLEFEKEIGDMGRGFLKASTPPRMSHIRDSHADFGIFWNDIIRAKRHYRPISQADEVTSEHTWRPINERIDKSVLDFLASIDKKTTKKKEVTNKKNPDSPKKAAFYAPPNLLAYLDDLPELKVEPGKKLRNFPQKDKDHLVDYKLKAYYEKAEIKKKTENLSHDWLQRTNWSVAIFIAWVSIAVIGFDYWLDAFLQEMSPLNYMDKIILAVIFVFVDWTESISNWRAARYPKKVVPKVIRMVMRLVSLIGVFSFLTGIICLIFEVWNFEISNPLDFVSFDSPIRNWFYIPGIAAVAIFFMGILEKIILRIEFWIKNKEKKKTSKKESIPSKNQVNNIQINQSWVKSRRFLIASFKALFFVLIGLVIFCLFIIAIFFSSGFIDRLIEGYSLENVEIEVTAGSLLFSLILSFIFYSAYKWVGKPMKIRTKIGSIGYLERSDSPVNVFDTLEKWEKTITQKWERNNKSEAEVKNEVRLIIEETLWRDVLGFIPIFTIIFGVILWIGQEHGTFEILNFLREINFPFGIPFWGMLIAVVASADYFEDYILFKQLKTYINKKNISGVWTSISFITSLIKFIGFYLSILLCIGVVCDLSFDALNQANGGWKWLLTNGIFFTIGVYLISLGYAKAKEKVSFLKKKFINK